jgi:hypothetical protein
VLPEKKSFISCRFPDSWMSWFKQILISGKLKTETESAKTEQIWRNTVRRGIGL